MRCPYCGAENPPNARYCGRCGNPVVTNYYPSNPANIYPKRNHQGRNALIVSICVIIGVIIIIVINQNSLSNKIIGTWKIQDSTTESSGEITFDSNSQCILGDTGSGIAGQLSGTYTVYGQHLVITFQKISAFGVELDIDTLQDFYSSTIPKSIEADGKVIGNTLTLSNEIITFSDGSVDSVGNDTFTRVS